MVVGKSANTNNLEPLNRPVSPKHSSEIIRDEILKWATTKAEKELAAERAVAIIHALETHDWVVIHNAVIAELLLKVTAVEKQNNELHTILTETAKKPKLILPH